MALGAAGTLTTACGPTATGASRQEDAPEELRDRLAATEQPLRGNEAQRAFQDVADAMADARDAGMEPQEMLGEVLASHARQWKRRDGMEAFLENNAELNGHSVTVQAPSRKGNQGAGGRQAVGGDPGAAPNAPAQAQAQPTVTTFFTNGVLNNSVLDLPQAGTALGDALVQQITTVYNRSAVDPVGSVRAGMAAAQTPDVKKDKPQEVVDLIDSLTHPLAVPDLMVTVTAAGDALKNSMPGLVNRWASPEAARKSPAYGELKKQVRTELNAGNRVVLVAHSDGCFIIRQVKRDLDADVSAKRPGPSPIGAIYIAPPFKDEDPTTLNTDDSRYILLPNDIINSINNDSLDPTAKATPPQPELNPLAIHFINNYLQKGSKTRQQIIDGHNGVTSYICKSPAVGGLKRRPGQEPECEEPPRGETTPGTQRPTETAPEETPGETSERPELTPEETPEETPGEQTPGTQTPEEPPADTPGEQTPHEPPVSPPEHTPAPQHVPGLPGAARRTVR
ncbi:hypothetical protein [Streptomyces montanus]|uniref:hypothetical protein n=1 Tax=Streptomyces montanus TaxID=2580423 RepID=UPI0010FD5CF7|nr:hypothetical protein [Streptomyces montanus]